MTRHACSHSEPCSQATTVQNVITIQNRDPEEVKVDRCEVHYPNTVANESEVKPLENRQYDALMYYADKIYCNHDKIDYTEDELVKMIRILTGADSVMIVWDEDVGCVKSGKAVHEIFVDIRNKDGVLVRHNFRQLIREYEFFYRYLNGVRY